MTGGATLVVLRPARVEDAAAIAGLFEQLGYPQAAATVAERLRRLLDHPHHAIRVASLDDAPAPVGLVALERRLILESGDRTELIALVVDRAVRRRGVARQLVDEAIRIAGAWGSDALFLRSNIARTEAHAFYPALGFAHAKTQHVYTRALATPRNAS
ncbi:GNAT family N-acetyltransferase [Luteimonas abyssi]|jgi:GNAT superfamily N-acetyltransferase|uniref:GNAT family N-acetyltransferase n=1 Tax=Luteimonas abyssi TaxID=1247514 RepID=UPI000737C1FD|nr:GNAT family N-acetyltransferase [Luteimonas abyssi]